MLAAVGEAAYVWDMASDGLSWSEGASELLGMADAGMLATGHAFSTLMDPDALLTRETAVRGAACADGGDGVPYELTYPLLPEGRGSQRRIWIEDIGRWYAGSDGRPLRAEGVVRVVTGRIDSEQRRAGVSRFDPLTGTLDRGRILEVLDETLAEAKREQTSCGLAILSIEGLGAVTEAYGVDAADELIAGAIKRIRTRMRGGDAIGRYSTSSFFIVLSKCNVTDLGIAMRRFADAVEESPIVTSAGPITARSVMGGVVGPRYGRSSSELIMRAREARFEARKRRNGGVIVYSPNPAREEQRRRDLEMTQELVNALNGRRISLAYQPVVLASSTGTVMWHEALARIETSRGIESIGRFVPPAERLGVISILDRRVLELAFAALDRCPDLHLAVNVSAGTMADHDWRDLLQGLIALVPGASERLMIEITETAELRDLDETELFVQDMRRAGIRVAIDDFGAGHTSFKVLRRLGVDLVKIDGEHIRQVLTSRDDYAFVKAVLGLARDIGFETVAECVDDPAIAEALVGMGVNYLQGHLFGAACMEMPLSAATPGISRGAA